MKKIGDTNGGRSRNVGGVGLNKCFFFHQKGKDGLGPFERRRNECFYEIAGCLFR